MLAAVPIPAEMLKSIRAERKRLTKGSKEVVEEEEYQLDDVNVDLSMVMNFVYRTYIHAYIHARMGVLIGSYNCLSL